MQARDGLHRLLLATMALIVYGSLFPWRFDFAHPSMLLASWPDSFDRYVARDILVNIIIYMPLGLFAFLTLRERTRTRNAVIAALLMGTALSLGVECAGLRPGPLFERHRHCHECTGHCHGHRFGRALRAHAGFGYPACDPDVPAAPSGSLLLVYVWLGYQLFPFFPVLSQAVVRWKIAAVLADPTLGLLALLVAFAEWLAVARLLEPILGQRALRIGLPVLMLLLPAKLLIYGRSFSVAEVAGATAAIIVWITYLHRMPWRFAAAAATLALGLLASGLAPFHFEQTGAHFLVPFSGLLGAAWKDALLVLMHKVFWYGALVVLLREAGLGTLATLTSSAALLAAIEIAQTHLHGRVAEITDPVLVLIVGLALTARHVEDKDAAATKPPHGSSSVSQYK
ncbi:MAG: hypothetical protein R3D67_07925 [Hyphomicrobiaceae bacterium]